MCEPAIVAAYAALGTGDPLAAAAAAVAGYHAANALDEAELAVVLPLMRLRLCVSVCVSAHQQALQVRSKTRVAREGGSEGGRASERVSECVCVCVCVCEREREREREMWRGTERHVRVRGVKSSMRLRPAGSGTVSAPPSAQGPRRRRRSRRPPPVKIAAIACLPR